MNHQPIEILLVEDNPGDAFLIREQLKDANLFQFQLTHVDHLHKAISYLKKEFFDLVLLDLVLPDSVGIASFLKIQDTNPQTPIILLSGMDDIKLATKALQQGAQDYLLKGQTTGALLERAIRYAIERKQIQEQLKQHILELEGFSYMVSHDLKNPLTTIQGMSSLLYEIDEMNALEGKECLEYILRSCSRMENLINDLMMLSQVKHTPIEVQSVDISNIVQQIISSLEQQQPDRKVEFIVHPQVIAQGSLPLLTIAFENLLNNSWKYTARKANPRIEFGTFPLTDHNPKLQYTHAHSFATAEKSKSNKDQPVYFLRDNGAGFDPAKANKLFTPFQRLHSKNQFPGTGIGLAIVKRIIQQHGGQIWFEAGVERGATFYFTLGKDRKKLN